MRTLLGTGYDDAMAPIGDLTSPRMREYAFRNGWDFLCVRSNPAGMTGNWIAPAGALSAFNMGYERVVWIESDIIVCHQGYQLPSLSPGLHLSRDWGDDAVDDNCFSTCAFVAFRDAIPILEKSISMEPEWHDRPFQFQAPLRHLRSKDADALNTIHIHPRRMFNSVPASLSVVEPWQPGDWLCHLTMISVPERVEMFHQILSQC